MGAAEKRLITVCDKCLRASCWQGVFLCDESRGAGTKRMTRAALVKLGREHVSYLKTDLQMEKANG